ncbi:subtilase family protein [Striga asiatica]|uniref:Subtilase family protein n=1 Tax=Striga asiatica TaxID=4170 RepID=A0A5A7P385_STRAF|nr:subtilase family protein [Striga asiatica]
MRRVEVVKGGDFRRDLDREGIAREVDELEVQRARGERVSFRWLSRRSMRRSWSRDAKSSMGQQRAYFNIQTETWMSCPHVSGLTALLKALSLAAIQSALDYRLHNRRERPPHDMTYPRAKSPHHSILEQGTLTPYPPSTQAWSTTVTSEEVEMWVFRL